MEEALIQVRRSITESAADRFRRRVAVFLATEAAKVDLVIERIMRPFLERVGA